MFVRVEPPNVITMSPSEFVSGHVFLSLDSIICDQLLPPPLWLHSQAAFVLLSCPFCCVSAVTGTLQLEPFITEWLTGVGGGGEEGAQIQTRLMPSARAGPPEGSEQGSRGRIVGVGARGS